jgi:hypothetical protein
MVSKGREQHLNLDPAGSIKSDSYARRLVSQHQGQELGGPTIVHQDSVAPRPPARPAAAATVIRGVLRAPVVGYWAAMDPIRRQAAIREHLDQLEAELIAPVTDGAAGAEMVAEDGGSDPGSVEPPD